MTKLFDPKKILKQTSNQLLQQFFRQRKVLGDLPWESFDETDIEPIFSGWQGLPDAERKQVQLVLQDLLELSDERGLKVIAEEVQRRSATRMPEFHALEGRIDKALWFYLNFPEAFEEVALFARADALSAGRYWVKRNSLPKGLLSVSEQMINSLQNGLRDYYWPQEMRGRHCKVQHYSRQNGNEYFFAYLDDWPDKQLVFEEDGQLEPRAERYAFSNVFVYGSQYGALELVAKGGQAVHLPLQKAFCKAILGIEVGPADPLRPVYRLDGLLDPSFTFPTDPADRIAQVRLARIRLEPISISRALEYLELKFSAGVERQESFDIIQRHLACNSLTPEEVLVKQASIQLTFMSDGDKRGKQMTFHVSVPNTCDLKSKPDEMHEIGDRCLKLWGITE